MLILVLINSSKNKSTKTYKDYVLIRNKAIYAIKRAIIYYENVLQNQLNKKCLWKYITSK